MLPAPTPLLGPIAAPSPPLPEEQALLPTTRTLSSILLPKEAPQGNSVAQPLASRALDPMQSPSLCGWQGSWDQVLTAVP